MGIRGQLLSLTLGFAIPLAVTGLIGLQWLWSDSQTQLDTSVRKQAELAAAAFEGWIEAERQPLVALAASASGRPDSQPLTEAELRSVVRAHPNWFGIEVRSTDGVTRISYPSDIQPLPPGAAASLHEGLKSGAHSALEMSWDLVDGKPTLLISTPLDGGEVLDARVDATSMRNVVRNIDLPPGSVITLFDPKQRVILRSPNGDVFVGRDMSGSPGLARLGSQRSVVGEGMSRNDGVTRVYGLARVGATGCAAGVGIPSAVLYEPARKQFDRYLLFSLIALSCAIVAALVIARKVSSPLLNLGDAARRLGAGDFTVRALEGGEAEVGELARVFNTMAGSLEEREAKLAELDRLKSEFVSGVSHELRTPLTTIKTLTQVLQRGGETPEQRAKYLEAISVECERQIDFVLDILDLSRLEAGAFSLPLDCVDVSQVIDAFVLSERFSADAAGVAIVKDIDPDLPYVLADAAAVRRVLRCLTENAVKFTPRDGTITISARESGGSVVVSVSDTGPGISNEDAAHIFEKFYQSPRAPESDSKGVGLGLYLARTIVEHLGGTIAVSSEPEAGSVFSVSLQRWAPGAQGGPTLHDGSTHQEDAREEAGADRR